MTATAPSRRRRSLTKAQRERYAAAVARTVYKFANRVHGRCRGVPGWRQDYREELVAAGWYGVALALKKYDRRRGAAFNTHATWWVRSAVGVEARNLMKGLRGVAATDFGEAHECRHGGGVLDRVADPRGVYQTVADDPVARDLLDAAVKTVAGPRNRLVVRLHLVDGYRFCEIAELLGVSRERVRQVIDRAMPGMRRRLKEAVG